MERKVYGETPNIALPRPMSGVGDPEFSTDSQNNDEFYQYDTDAYTENLDDDR